MVLLPCSKCCGKCTCTGCLQLYASGSTADQKDPCFAFNYEARKRPFVGSYVGDLELDGERYECAYRFGISYDEISGADVTVGFAYLVLPKDVKPPNPSGPSQPPNGKALFFVRTSLGWTADYEIDNVKECPRYVAPGEPGATVDPNADEGYSITFTKADMVASTGNPDECGELTFTVTECHDPPPPPKRYTCRQRSCENPLDCPFDCVEDPNGEYDEPTCGGNCEPKPNPCSVLVDGKRVPVSSFDPYEVITAKWRGFQASGRQKVFVNGVLDSDIPSLGSDSVLKVTSGGCDAGGQTNDFEGVFIATGGVGVINACLTAEASTNYQTLVCEGIDETKARLYGGVGTVKIYSPCLIAGNPSGDSIQEEDWWLWECLLVDGVPGKVKVTPSVGARYFNSNPVLCEVTHEAPEVTLDFVP
jgi:hypothetical protein